jgi:hypothetical protein
MEYEIGERNEVQHKQGSTVYRAIITSIKLIREFREYLICCIGFTYIILIIIILSVIFTFVDDVKNLIANITNALKVVLI